MMKIESKKNYLVSLESVVMTDIVLNMFIFFFISFSLLYTFNPHRVQRIEVKLPRATNISPLDESKQINITISAEGLTYVDGEYITASELKEKISAKYKNNPYLALA